MILVENPSYFAVNVSVHWLLLKLLNVFAGGSNVRPSSFGVTVKFEPFGCVQLQRLALYHVPQCGCIAPKSGTLPFVPIMSPPTSTRDL